MKPIEIKFSPICGKGQEMLYGNDVCIMLTENMFFARSEFAYSHPNEDDDKMPNTDVIVDEAQYAKRESLLGVEWAFCSEGEVWLFQLRFVNDTVHWNVKDKETAIEIVNTIVKWIN